MRRPLASAKEQVADRQQDGGSPTPRFLSRKVFIGSVASYPAVVWVGALTVPEASVSVAAQQTPVNKKMSRWSGFIEGRPLPPKNAARAFVLGVLPGEGVGPEVIKASLKVLAAVQSVVPWKFDIQTVASCGAVPAASSGGRLHDSLAQFCARVFAEGGAILAGPFGGRLVYELRKRFGLFCKICPVQPAAELHGAGRIKPEHLQDVDFLVIRENVSGVYQGQWHEDPARDGGRRADHRFSYTEEEVRRILRPAARIAHHRRGELAVVIKDGGVPSISNLWRDCATDEASQAGVKLSVLNVDHAAYCIIQHAQALDVVVAPNLFGDILGDLCGVLLGSRGLTYSGNFAADVAAIYQTSHGAAHDLAASDRANPVGQIYSLAMLLRESYGLSDAADLVERAVRAVWRQGWRTDDIAEPGCRPVGTQQMGDLIAGEVIRLVRENRPA